MENIAFTIKYCKIETGKLGY